MKTTSTISIPWAANCSMAEDARVFTTPDGEKNLQPRPGVVGLRPWQTVSANIGGKQFRITGTPCKHFPGGEVTGFILESDMFGINAESGLPNVVYFSGDTVWIDELAELKKRWCCCCCFKLGECAVSLS